MRVRGSAHALLGGLLVCTGWLVAAGSPAYGQPRTSDSNVGYVFNALVGTQVRLRVDAAYGNNVPDRAEFFYAKCGCFQTDAPPLRDARAKGPPVFPETNIDYQEVIAYLETAFTPRFSGFIETPYRLINPDANRNANGFGDISGGFKWSVLASDTGVVTLMLQTYVATGDPPRGLGNNHITIEQGILFFERLTEQLALEGEFRNWTPINGTDFSGDVLRYGLGLSYEVYQTPTWRVRPVGEIVGWTALSGKSLRQTPSGTFSIEDAEADTIVNAKVGLRVLFGENSSFYAGYGRALTGEVWYKDIMRFEYRWYF